jgi:glycosyltransferase involved in cell wall biosynthesis
MIVYAHYPLTETRVQREAEALIEAGYDVDVICLRGDGERPRERYRGVEVHRLPITLDKRSLPHQLVSYLRFTVRAAIRLSRLHAARPYGSVQVHNLPDFLVFCALGPKRRGVPVILDLHDLMPEFFAGRFGAERHPILARAIRWQERAACRFADHVITVSEPWRRSLIARGVAPERCSVVLNVADTRVFVPSGRRRRDNQFHLIYHGSVTYRYGLDLAVRAVGLVRDEIPQIKLTILGRGDQMPALLELRRRAGLQDCVELRDEFLLAEALPELIAEADVGLAPYRNDVFTDGLLPTKLMEYAVLGLPCIAARTTAIEALFRDTMVEFFEPGDAADLARCIRDLHAHPGRRAELARRSQHFTSRYNWDRVGSEYVALVDSLAESADVASGRW